MRFLTGQGRSHLRRWFVTEKAICNEQHRCFSAAGDHSSGAGIGNVKDKMLPSSNANEMFRHTKYPRTASLIGYVCTYLCSNDLKWKIKCLPITCVLTLFLTLILSLRAPMTYGQPYVGTVRHYNMPCLRSLSMVWCNKIFSQCSYDVCLFILRMLGLLC